MLVDNCSYDPVKDVSAVDPYGFVNLRSAYENGNVPTNIEDVLANYNGIDDPESIIGSPKDIFEGYRMRDAILAKSEKLNDKTNSASSVISKTTE